MVARDLTGRGVMKVEFCLFRSRQFRPIVASHFKQGKDADNTSFFGSIGTSYLLKAT